MAGDEAAGDGTADGGTADGGSAIFVDATGGFGVTWGEFMIVNEPVGVVGLSAFGFVIASRCIRSALSNCSLTDADGADNAVEVDDGAVVTFESAGMTSGWSAGSAGSVAGSDVEASAADVTPSSIPLALANRILAWLLESTWDDAQIRADRAGVRFHVPDAGLEFPTRALNTGSDCLVFIDGVVDVAPALLKGGPAATVTSSENVGVECAKKAIIARVAMRVRTASLVSE